MAVILVGMAETSANHWRANQEIPLEVYERNLINAITDILATLPSKRDAGRD
jgi:hypothetical protein